MATLGNSATPGSGFFYDDVGNSQFWSGAYTMPAGGGIVTDVFVYCAGDGANAFVGLNIWGSSAVLFQGNGFTIGSGSRSIGGQAWQHTAVPNLYIPAGAVNIGFWAQNSVVWTFEGSGSTNFQRTGSVASLSSGGTEGSGALGAYIVYTPGNGHVKRGGSFASGPVAVMRSGTFNNGVLSVMRNGTWVQGS